MNIVPFYHMSHPLSNWYIHTIQDPESGLTFPTCEHYLMYYKIKTFTVLDNLSPGLFASSAVRFNQELLAQILLPENAHPAKAKQLGKAIRGFNDYVWSSLRYNIGKKGCHLKLLTCVEVQRFLSKLVPDETILCEASPTDFIWGIGMSADNPNLADLSKWGSNLLGNIWQELLRDFSTT